MDRFGPLCHLYFLSCWVGFEMLTLRSKMMHMVTRVFEESWSIKGNDHVANQSLLHEACWSYSSGTRVLVLKRCSTFSESRSCSSECICKRLSLEEKDKGDGYKTCDWRKYIYSAKVYLEWKECLRGCCPGERWSKMLLPCVFHWWWRYINQFYIITDQIKSIREKS